VAIGVALTAVIFCFGKISGGHFNPVVTTTAWLNEKMSMNTFLLYLLAQFLGGITAWYFVKRWSNLPQYPSRSSLNNNNNTLKESTFPTSSSVGLTPNHSTIQE
jgi:aquaporin Z